MRLFIILLIFLLPFDVVFSQKEGNNWHFGIGAALDFSSGSPVISTPSSMFTVEGSATISDSDGNLLFYSNGGGRDPVLSGQSSGKIWNRNHEVMYDMGNAEGGGFSAAQSSVIVPKPGMVGRYYLFTMEEVEFDVGGSVPGQPQGRGLSYFEIDMAQNGGLGGVVDYQGMILVPSFEGLCTVRHQNGIDYWIIAHNSNIGMSVFPITSAGVGSPTTYSIPGSSGIIKGSPNGRWICSSTGIFPFDNQTGVITDAGYTLGNAFLYYEFSPDSKRLFFTNNNSAFGYFNLAAVDIIGSATIFAEPPPFQTIFGQMQLAPDGNIYVVESDGTSSYLSVIFCPNAFPSLNRRLFKFQSDDLFFLGLPNFDNAFFRNDEATSTLNVDLGEDITICDNQTISLSTGFQNATYSWSNGAVSDTIQVSAPGQYSVTVSTAGCGLGTDTIQVSLTTLSLEAGENQAVCSGTAVQLEASTNGLVTWVPSDLVDDPNSPITLFKGDSSATLVATAVLGNCAQSDTIQVNLLITPEASVQPADTTIEAGASVELLGLGAGTYLWSPPSGLSCTDCPNPIVTPDSTTTFLLEVVGSNGCIDTASVTINVLPIDCSAIIPNAFTPNSDGSNDLFRILGKNVEVRALTIYNRWGQEVYQGNTAWDGRVSGLDAPTDVYLYVAEILVCGSIKREFGQITLIR
ncbi:MAG: gliding motility-associated C-terminal domain-containing protein [Chitinophagales bacterium]